MMEEFYKRFVRDRQQERAENEKDLRQKYPLIFFECAFCFLGMGRKTFLGFEKH